MDALRSSLARLACGVCLSLGFAYASVLHAQSVTEIEGEVRAAFLYNFAKYVEWPTAALAEGAPFRICVLADKAFIKNVDTIVAGELIAGRTVTRETPGNADAARACQILYVGRSEIRRAESLLVGVVGRPVLTVSDTPDFLSHGGIILFVRESNRVRFDVNPAEGARRGLTISSRLLRVARRVLADSQGL